MSLQYTEEGPPVLSEETAQSLRDIVYRDNKSINPTLEPAIK